MTQKTVNFYYKRDSLPHSEFAAIKSLAKFLEDDTQSGNSSFDIGVFHYRVWGIRYDWYR